MPTLLNLQYRTMDDLLGSVMIDFASYNADNTIDPAELIKIAQKCNWDLGLKINQTKETVLDIEHGRTKLPADFYSMNVALLCSHYETTYPSISNGIQGHTVMTSHTSPNLTSCPCWTVVCTSAVDVPVTHCDSSTSVVTFAIGTTKICAKNIDISNAPVNSITLSTKSFCYYDHNDGTYSCTAPAICNTCSSTPCTCNCINPDPWFKDKVYSLCDNTVGVKVVQECRYERREYTHFEKVYMVSPKEATSFCLNSQFRDCHNQAQIKGNFLEISVDCSKLYICYEGALEDDNGNLLVLDHPNINEFYEWSLKRRILSNLYLNGEPDIERRLQYTESQYKLARIEAMSIVNTPDYAEVKNSISAHRSDTYSRYILPFQRLFGSEGFIHPNNY